MLRGSVSLSICVLLALATTVLSCAPILAKPSADLQTLLDTKLPGIHVEKKQLYDAVEDLRKSLKTSGAHLLPSVGIEYTAEKMPPLSIDVPPGAFEEQLNHILSTYHYVWLGDGNWINLVPADAAADSSYIYNMRVAGQVVISRDPAKNTTKVSDWLKARGYTLSILFVGCHLFDKDDLSYQALRPNDPILLNNPTYREVDNASFALQGYNAWMATVKPVRPKEGVPPGPYKHNIVYTFGNLPQ